MSTQKQTKKTTRRPQVTRRSTTKRTSKKHGNPVINRLRLLFIPHKRNDYRPHLIRRYGLMTVLALVVGMQLTYNFTNTGSVLGKVTTITSSALLADTNSERAKNHLTALTLNSNLSAAATAKAQDMIARGYWSHNAPDGTEPWHWIEQSGYNYQEAGENLAKDFSTADATVGAWMDSPSHRDNLLKASYADVGFGIANGKMNGKKTTVVVAFYAKPVTGALLAVNKSVSAPAADTHLSIASRVGIGLQSLTPAAATSIALLFMAATVAITAHFYRSQLPKNLRNSWYRHHGVAKMSGLLSIAAFILLIYGGGQI